MVDCKGIEHWTTPPSYPSLKKTPQKPIEKKKKASKEETNQPTEQKKPKNQIPQQTTNQHIRTVKYNVFLSRTNVHSLISLIIPLWLCTAANLQKAP